MPLISLIGLILPIGLIARMAEFFDKNKKNLGEMLAN
jgi:hypothetical protein